MKSQVHVLIAAVMALTVIACGGSTGGGVPAIDMSTAESPAPDRFTGVRRFEAGDLLSVQLARESHKAVEADRRPFLYVYADWCGPCQSLHASLGDQRMVDAFSGTYIILANLDEWRSQVDGSDFDASE